MNRLFKDQRECISCERSATPRMRIAGEPTIAAVSFVIYLRGDGKRQTKGARRVRICTDCLAKALAAPRLWEGVESRKFLAAIRESLSARYSEMLEADALDQVTRPKFGADGKLIGDLY